VALAAPPPNVMMGTSSTLVTVTVKFPSTDALNSSFTSTRRVWDALFSKSRISAVVKAPPVERVNFELLVALSSTREKVRVAPASGSVAVKEPTEVPAVWFSASVNTPLGVKLVGVLLV
jgi:hypothetical protein